jgi:hypothetical protein
LVQEELRRGTLKAVRLDEWPLSRKIRAVIIRGHFTSKAVQHLLELVRKKMPEGDYVDLKLLRGADVTLLK